MLLVDVIHPGASLECRREALRIVEYIFMNIVTYPSEGKYRRVNISSEKWRERVAPAFYIFQFFEWMIAKGFEQDLENSSLFFPSDCLTGVFEALDEVRMLRRMYSTPVSQTGSDKDVADKLLSSLRIVAGLKNSHDVGNLNCTEGRSFFISDALWAEVKSNLRRVVLGDKIQKTSIHPSLPEGNALVWGSLLDLLSGISLYKLEEDMSIIDAERFDAVQSSSKSDALEGELLQRMCIRRRVAERHKKNFAQQEINKDRAKIHREVQLVASRLINDIASCMEQVALLKGNESIVRTDRIEAWRLLKKFYGDGDIEYLHVMLEEWTKRLEEEKKVQSKFLVYSNP